jgi:5,10-methylenetetrahydrofolate reductase
MMLRQIPDGSELAQAIELRRNIADGQADLSAAWLAETDARVLAHESGRHLEADEAQSLAETYLSQGVTHLVAVVNDPLVADEVAYSLDPAADDLREVSREFAGISFLLSDVGGSRCVLFTTDDFKLVAGPLAFVEHFAGDPLAAREAFVAFAEDHLEDLRPILARAASYMSWVAG